MNHLKGMRDGACLVSNAVPKNGTAEKMGKRQNDDAFFGVVTSVRGCGVRGGEGGG